MEKTEAESVDDITAANNNDSGKVKVTYFDAIIEITDDLYIIRDGYTFPIKSREDLIHHGYILR